jgi:CRP-like cAMP-binding protein/glyoxylase-like metal-dependent hydrolase (beta-lactamase superfamily II)
MPDATSASAASRVRHLPNSMHVVETRAGSVLVNCPPEALKYLLAEGLVIPKTVLIPPDLPIGQQLGSSGFVRQGISYASVEFLLYYHFFIGKGQRTRLITVTERQAHRLRQILEETIDGPANPADYAPFPWLQRECQAVAFFPPLGRPPGVSDLAEVGSLEKGGGQLGDGVQVQLIGDRFVFREDGAEVAAVGSDIHGMAIPLTLAPPYPVLRHELTLQFIGGSDGFDPNGITTCFLAYLGATGHSKATLFDVAAYLRVRLGNLGTSPSQISEVVLSHLHEDHMAGLPELLLMGETRVRLLTSSIIYTSLLKVLGAMLDVPAAEVAALFDFYPLNPGQPLMLEGRRFESIYAVHSIPTIAVRVNELCYSGDMRYDEQWFAELETQGLLSAERRAELTNFAEDAAVLVQDAGGGAIHTTLTPEIIQSLASKSRRVVFAHTSKPGLPAGQDAGAAEGVEFAGSGHVTALGAALEREADADRVETLSACPLFARLPVAERAALAAKAIHSTWTPGQIIVREGEVSDRQTFVIHAGLVEVWSHAELIRVLGRGTSIGERGALQGEVRTGSLIARGPVELLGFSAEVFGPIAEALGLNAAFGRADWLAHHPTFGHFPWATLLDLALDFQPRQYQPNEVLFRYGDPGHECFLLISGAVSIETRDGQSLGALTQAGEFFGGRAALFGTARNASARATVPSEVWALPAPALHRLQTVYPNVLLHLRIVESSRMGVHPLISSVEPEPEA